MELRPARWLSGRSTASRNRVRLLRRARTIPVGLRGIVYVLVGVLVAFLFEVAKDVVENKVAVRLLGEEKSLSKLAPPLAFVGHLSEHLNDNAAFSRALAVHIRDVNLAILKA